MAGQRIRIKLKSFDHTVLDKSAGEIVKTARRAGAAVCAVGRSPFAFLGVLGVLGGRSRRPFAVRGACGARARVVTSRAFRPGRVHTERTDARA